MNRIHTSLGELISALYEEYLVALGDEDQAALATAASIQELLQPQTVEQAAA